MFRLIRSSTSSPQKAAGNGQLRGFERMSAKKEDEDRRMANALPRVSDDPRMFARIGYLVIIVTFGVIGGWAAFAPLAGAVVASGVVVTEGNKKTIQHLEGGIVKEIRVLEGDHVDIGDTLIRLDDTAPKANLEITRNQLYAAVAREARLEAELESRSAIQFPEELTSVRNDAIAIKAMYDQASQFAERGAMIAGQISILNSRADQLRKEIEGLDRQRAGNEEQVKFIIDELDGVRQLYERNLVPKTRWAALERERARLEGDIGKAIAEHAKAEKSIGETELQISQTKQNFLEQVSRDLVDTREKLRDLRNKFVVAQDVMRRLDIFAPINGRVQNLKFYTIGAVVRAGEPLLEIAPDQDKLIVQAHVSPLDIKMVAAGNAAEVRFAAFHERSLPIIPATVVSLSQDRLMDEASKQPYYLALINVPDDNLPPQYRGKLTAGMNADVLIPTRERTTLDYLIEPLLARMRTVFREK
jgi:membrane fusion protein, type I secretion system